jgi:glycosyltransferase involved in cell wall biosynthesis
MSIRDVIIWMNVTTSENWQRPPVGIVRVERSLSSELSSLYGQNFKKCVWLNDRFVELDNILKKDELNLSKKTNQSTIGKISEFFPIYPVVAKRQALILMAQALLSLLPAVFQPMANRILLYLRPKIVRLLNKKIVRSIQLFFNKIKSSNSELKSSICNSRLVGNSIFNPGDVLISIGLDWDHSYYKDFYRLRKINKIKVVSCCYDLIPVLYPQYCVNDVAGIFTSYFIEVADGSDLILCISKQSEKDLNDVLHQTGAARPLTNIFPLGDNVPSEGCEEMSQAVQSVLKKPFILFVSTIERRKNHEVLYRAYHLLCKQGKKAELPTLVFVGMPGWGVGELFKDIELDPITHEMIIRLNHVNDTELRKLYESALFCVFPSLYEGWGLPVGEALSMGKVVLSSDRGSLPEVGGNLVRYIDPWSPQLWADELYKMATDHAWRSAWEERVKDEYITRTWSDAAVSVKNSISLLIKTQ